MQHIVDISPRTGKPVYWVSRIWTERSLQKTLTDLSEQGFTVIKNGDNYYASRRNQEVLRAIHSPVYKTTELLPENRWRVEFHPSLTAYGVFSKGKD